MADEYPKFRYWRIPIGAETEDGHLWINMLRGVAGGHSIPIRETQKNEGVDYVSITIRDVLEEVYLAQYALEEYEISKT